MNAVNAGAAETFELEIDSVAFGGMGVGRDCGRVCFVPRTIAGERAKVSVVKPHKRFAVCRLHEVLRPSPDRVAPDCPHWDEGCNGCRYRHMSYAEQSRMRREQISGLLQHVGALSAVPEVGFTAAENLAGFRNSLTFRLVPGEGGSLVPAFKREDGTLLPISRCLLGGGHIFNALPGILSGIEDAFDGRHMPAACALTVKEDAAGRTDFLLCDSRQRALMRGGTELLFTHNGRTLAYGADTFFQTNPEMLAKFIDHMRAEIKTDVGADVADAVFFDIYAGVGTVSVHMSDLVSSCAAIESSRASVAAARRNFAAAGNCRVTDGPAQKRFRPVFNKRRGAKNIVFVNPPRTGCAPDMLRALRAAAAETDALYYLCCEPSILARDLKRLLAEGEFAVESVHAFDMFAWTMHVETLVKLRPTAK